MARRRYVAVTTEEQFLAMREELLSFDVIAIDTETTGLDVHADDFQLVGVSFAAQGDKSFYVPLAHASFAGLDYQPENYSPRAVRNLLREIYESRKQVIMHNAAYDRSVLKRTLDIDFDETRGTHDTMLALHLVDENARDKSLKGRARQFLGITESKKKFADIKAVETKWWDEALITTEKVEAISKTSGRKYKKNVYHLKPDWVDILAKDWLLKNSGAESIQYVFDYVQQLMNFFKRRHIVTFDEPPGKDFRYVPVPIASIYAGDDTINTRLLWDEAVRGMDKWKVRELYENYELPVDDVMMRASYRGIMLDLEEFERMERVLVERMEEAKAEAMDAFSRLVPPLSVIDGTYNLATALSSPVQLQKLLYEELGFKPFSMTDTGNPSTDQKNLKHILKQRAKDNSKTEDAHRFIQQKLKYEDLKKIHGTYAKGIPALADSRGFIHPSFNVAGTVSGRMSSSGPNFQNVPRMLPEELEEKPWLNGIDIRKGLVAPPGWVFVDFDWQAMEVRVTAALSRDENLIKLLEEGRDMHAYTARHAFNVGWDLTDAEFKKVFKNERQKAKVVNFAMAYGGTAYTFIYNFGFSEEEAQRLEEGYYEAYPGVKRFIEETYRQLEEVGYIVYPEPFGYVKRMDIMNPRTWEEKRQFRGALRSCQNALVQGYSAFIAKRAVIEIDRDMRERGLRGFVNFQIHDEIGVCCPEEEAAEVFDIMRNRMNQEVFGVPLPAEGEVVRTMSKSAVPLDLLDLVA